MLFVGRLRSPCGLISREKGTPLLRAFERQLGAGPVSKPGPVSRIERRHISGARGPVRVAQDIGVDPAAAAGDNGANPGLQAGAVAHGSVGDHGFEAMGIAEGAGREARRSPGEQAVETRRWGPVSWCDAPSPSTIAAIT